MNSRNGSGAPQGAAVGNCGHQHSTIRPGFLPQAEDYDSPLPAADIAEAAASAAAERSGCGASAAAFPGLVHSVTSDTDFVVRSKETRLKRMKRSTITAARLHEEDLQAAKGGFRWWIVMITPTYASGVSWHAWHMTDLVKCIREYLRRKKIPCRYVWVMELTKKGKPHYHLLIWLPYGFKLPMPDKRGWWKKGSTTIEKARNPVGYVAKYASKGNDTEFDFPKKARICGSGGLSDKAKRERRWWLTPRYVRNYFPCSELDVFRAAGGGWVARATGEWLESKFELVGYGFECVTVREKPGWAEKWALATP